jgi:hypothetical protein
LEQIFNFTIYTLRTLILLGDIFDPQRTKSSNSEVLAQILNISRSFEDIIVSIKPLTGRYALLYKDNSQLTIIHDAYGVREIYFCTQHNRVVCGSQPNLLDSFANPKLGIAQDPEIIQFYTNEMKNVRMGRLWVGDESYFQYVKHLMPNHYLDINSTRVHRYWPSKELVTLDLESAIQLSCNYLQGFMKAVTNRYKVMMAVTAGFDSRSLLAASREVKDLIYYFVNKEHHLTDKSADIWVPREMLKKLNVPFHIHDVNGPIDEDFKKIYLNNCFWARDRALPTIHNVYFKFHQDKVNLLGLGEIGRVYYGESPSIVDGYYLARSLKYKHSYYATKQCSRWLQETIKIASTFNIDIMKLFLWEGLIANWSAIGNAESDIAIEEFDPYSSHYIIEILLSFNRDQGDLFKGMYKRMWPELLEFPLNPPDSITDGVKQMLRDLQIYMPLQRCLYKLDQWRYRKMLLPSGK